MEVTYARVNELLEEIGYFTVDEIIWQIVTNIDTMINGGFVSQGLYTICLTGPAGSGKTEFAKVYRKVLSAILGEEVELVQYQCIPETGKSEMFEEVNIAAVALRNAEDVMIPGELVRAVELTNQGKRVILFLDEYDKAGAGMDAYLLSFLQEGRVFPTQLGTQHVRPEYMQNLQVILCMNVLPKDFTAALSRRRKPLPLSEMHPDIFYRVAHRKLPDADPDIVNLVVLIYQEMYKHRLDFERIPSCSENLWAIHDAGCLIRGGAPKEIVYNAIMVNMVKNVDDRATLVQLLRDNDALSEFIRRLSTLKSESAGEDAQLRSQVMRDYFAQDLEEFYQNLEDAQATVAALEKENQQLLNQMHEQKQALSDQNETIAFLEQSLLCVPAGETTSITSDEAAKIKVGDTLEFTTIQRRLQEIIQLDIAKTLYARVQPERSVFGTTDADWNEFGCIILECVETLSQLTQKQFGDYVSVAQLLEQNPDAIACRDGYILWQGEKIAITAVRVIEKGRNPAGVTLYENKYKFYANSLVLPIQAFARIVEFMEAIQNAEGCAFNCLVASDAADKDVPLTFSEVEKGIYHLRFEKEGGGQLLDAASKYFLTTKEDLSLLSAQRKQALEDVAYAVYQRMASEKQPATDALNASVE